MKTLQVQVKVTKPISDSQYLCYHGISLSGNFNDMLVENNLMTLPLIIP